MFKQRSVIQKYFCLVSLNINFQRRFIAFFVYFKFDALGWLIESIYRVNRINENVLFYSLGTTDHRI